MKFKTLLLMTAALLAAVTIQAQVNVLSITELDESATPVVTYNGSPVTLDASSTLFKDNWTVVLPSSFALSAIGEVFVGEPENAALVNDILVGTQPTTLTWLSDVAPPGGATGPFLNPVTIPSAGTFTTATGGSEPFVLVLADQITAHTPDQFATAGLFALALLGLWGAARLRIA